MAKRALADRILGIVQKQGSVSGAAIAAALGISRQAVHAHLGRMLDAGELVRRGRTRGVQYMLPSSGKRPPSAAAPEYQRSFDREGLQEDAVFAELSLFLGLRAGLSKVAYKVFNYAFTEMLNNAIEHSHSVTCAVRASLAAREIRAVIRDHGVGVFHSIALRMGLRDENDAIGELLKGKATTMPDRHTGEGIFFTSKACDRLTLRSHRIECAFNGRTGDVVVNLRKPIRGTEVNVCVSRSARRRLEDVFAAFAPEEYDFRFERSIVTVRFVAKDYVSRSEAKRLVARLDSFREVVLDFDGVRSIGQGFADEIFRIFRSLHPRILLSRVNVEPALEAVIRHVIDNTETTSLTID
jgi:anti-sigma regulatory factor (Ser/Thr protein kinase)/biotin operon repressor